MVEVLREARHAGEFLVSEANGSLSREAITVAAGADLEAGAVLGRITASKKYTAINPDGKDGSEVAAGILWGPVAALAADASGVAIVRDAEVNAAEIVWPAGLAEPRRAQAIGALASLHIILR